MTRHVAYPPLDAEKMRTLLGMRTRRTAQTDSIRFASAWQAQMMARDWVAPAAYGWALDRDEKLLGRCLENYLQGTVVAFLVASTQKPVQVRLGDEERTCPVQVDPSVHHVGELRSALWTAFALRDLGARQLLETVPTDLVRKSPTQASAYAFAMLDAMRAMFRGEADAPARTVAALELTQPSHLDPRLPAVISDTLAVPVLELMFRVMDSDSAGFTTTLLRALELRVTWYTKTGRALVPGAVAMAPEFLLPFDLIGLTALAKDRGMNVDVTSDFLPAILVEGRLRTDVAKTIRLAD